MNNRTVIITGANSGIGKEATLRFAKEGNKVIMACRNLDISRKVQEQIMEASNNDQVELMELDVSSFASIRTFCRSYQSRYERLDILIHNAGYFNHGAPYEFKHTTGKLFNDQLEIMQPSPKEYPGYIKQMKQILGSNVYPAYPDISDQLWARCTELTRNRVVVEDQRIHDTNNAL